MTIDKLSKAKYFYDKKKYSRTKELCVKICKKSNDIEPMILLADVYRLTGMIDDAIGLYNKILTHNGSSIQALTGLGKCYLHYKNDLAEEVFNKCLSIDDRNIDSLKGVSEIYICNNDYVQAKNILLKILSFTTKDIDVFYLLSKVEFDLNFLDSAEKYATHAIDIDSNHSAANHLLGRICMIKARLPESIEYYKHSIRYDNRNISLLLEISNVLIISGRIEESIIYLKKALKIDSRSYGAIAGLSVAYGRLKKYEDAYNLLEPVISDGVLDPGIAKAYGKICMYVDGCESAIKYIHEVIENCDLYPQDISALHFILGEYYDKGKDYSSSFSHYNRANDIKPDNYSDIEYKAMVDAIISSHDSITLCTIPRSNFDKYHPVFIVGMPRSGTSLIEQILSSHSDVFGAGELTYIKEEIYKLGNTRPYPYNIKSINENEIKSSSSNYYNKVRSLSNGEKYVTDKMPHNFLYLGLISRMFPGAKIIHCIRDPRDVCLSIYFQDFHDSHSYSTRFKNIVSHYNEYLRLMDHWRHVLPVSMLDIVYEDLVGDQELQTKRLLDFIGLDWEPACLEFYNNKRSVATSSFNQVNKKIYTGSISRWVNYNEYLGEYFDNLSS